MNEPAISVVMPVYNAAPFVSACIDSILRQTLPDFEFLILDDGSDDETPGILRAHAAQDARIRLVFGARRGIVATRNDGLVQARSNIVAVMDADDISHPERLHRQYQRLVEDPDLWVLGTQFDLIGPGNTRAPGTPLPVSSDDVSAKVLTGFAVCHPSVLMRRDRILGIGGYRPAYPYSGDYDL